jgi:cytochrome c peroxidase
LVDRIRGGFELHRQMDLLTDGQMLRERAEPIARYVREGLVPPPKHAGPLTAEEEKGKALFESPKTQCATCHAPAKEFTDRTSVPLPSKAPPLFDEDPNRAYKVPSLFFVGGTPPYYHDGSAPTLELLVEKNGDHMGRTSHLDPAERAALVAYLRTL